MLDANQVRNIEREQALVTPPVLRNPRLETQVSAAIQEVPAANDGSTRRARRRLRSLIWDDGGLKPFRVA